MPLSNIPNQPVQFGIQNDLTFCANDIQPQLIDGTKNDVLSFQLRASLGSNLLTQTFAGWTKSGSGTWTDISATYGGTDVGRLNNATITQSGVLTSGDYYKLTITVYRTEYRRELEDELCNDEIPRVLFGTNRACIYASNVNGAEIEIYGRSNGTDISIVSEPGYFDFDFATATLERVNDSVEVYIKNSQTGAETLESGALKAVYQGNLHFEVDTSNMPDCSTLLVKNFSTTIEALVCGDFSCADPDAVWDHPSSVSLDAVNDEYDFIDIEGYIEQTLADTFDECNFNIEVNWRVDSGSNVLRIDVYDGSNNTVAFVQTAFKGPGTHKTILNGTFGTNGPYKIRAAMANADSSITSISCAASCVSEELESVEFKQAGQSETIRITGTATKTVDDGWYNDIRLSTVNDDYFSMRLEADYLPRSFERDFQSYKGANGQLANIYSETFKAQRLRIHPIPVYQWEALMWMLSLPGVYLSKESNAFTSDEQQYVFEGDGISPDFDKNACVAGGEIELKPTPQNSLARKQ